MSAWLGDWRNSLGDYLRVVGTLTRIDDRGAVVKHEENGIEYRCAPNSIRRLIRKPRRRWVLKGWHEAIGQVFDGPTLAPGETVEVIEVRKGKK